MTSEDDVDDAAGHTSILDGDEADGIAGYWNGFGGDEENDNGYKNHFDDDDASDSEREPDLVDDVLGPEDGKERVTKWTHLDLQPCRVVKYIGLGHGSICRRILFFLHDNGCIIVTVVC